MVGVKRPYGSLLETLLSSVPVGQIRYNRHGRISFAFEPAYLKQERPPALSLSLLSDDGQPSGQVRAARGAGRDLPPIGADRARSPADARIRPEKLRKTAESPPFWGRAPA